MKYPPLTLKYLLTKNVSDVMKKQLKESLDNDMNKVLTSEIMLATFKRAELCDSGSLYRELLSEDDYYEWNYKNVTSVEGAVVKFFNIYHPHKKSLIDKIVESCS